MDFINSDVGLALPVGNERDDNQGTLNIELALSYQFRDCVQPEVKRNYSSNYFTNEDDAKTLAVTVGLVMPIRESLRLNLGLQQTL